VTRSVFTRVLALGIGLVLACPVVARAHEKWFLDARSYPTDWRALLRFPSVLAVAIALAATVVVWLLWRVRRGRDLIPGPEVLGATEAGRARFYSLVPLILGIHIALPLIVLGITGVLFSPNNALPAHSLYWLGTAEIGVGLCFLYGGLTRLGAVVLAVIWLRGIGVVGLEPMLENLHVLGFATFFGLAGRGPFAVDRLLFPSLEPSPQLVRRAMVTLRVATGGALAVVAFTEKLANPALARAFLQHHPLNFTSWLGIPMSDDLFILCAGTTELVIGLCLIFGLFPRVIILTSWLFINMTLTIFNWVELVGHLPLYGVMGILLVWTPREEDQRAWISGVVGTPTGRTSEPHA
jgi:uncharacterized membrane protein YphA (DoxX/SURF4 family)